MSRLIKLYILLTLTLLYITYTSGKSGEERIREERRGKEEENGQAIVKVASTALGAWKAVGSSSVRPELNAKAQVQTWPECSDVRPRTEGHIAGE